MKTIRIQDKRYFIDFEASDGEEVSILYSTDEVSQLDKGVLSNGYVTMSAGNVRIKYDRNQFAKLTPVPDGYEYHTSEGEELFIGITRGHDDYGSVNIKTHIIKAKDVAEANIEFQKTIMKNYFDEEDGVGRMNIANAEIFQISGYLILDLDHISSEWNKTIKEKYENEKLEEERLKYEKLKQKFEGPTK